MKLTKQCNNYPKIHGQTGGAGVAQSPRNTPLDWRESDIALWHYYSLCGVSCLLLFLF